VYERPVRLLTFTTLFPNQAQPNHGIFVENRLRHTLALGGIETTVLAPVPYFPWKAAIFGSYARYARVPAEEQRHGTRILHPRYLVLPKIGSALTPYTLYLAAWRACRKLLSEGRAFDVIDAHYFYPDGVAAAFLARRLRLPLVITGRGTDLTLLPRFPLARRAIRLAADRADAIVTVCHALKDRLVTLGTCEDKIHVLRNGVDLALFNPDRRREARTRLGLAGPVLLSVGSLIARKGHDLAIKALAQLPDCTLIIAGEGPKRAALEGLARNCGVEARLHMLGEQPHEALAPLYAAADILILASEREGWANVLLESMACGTPVVATRVDGTAEVVRDERAGRLVDERTSLAIAQAVRSILANPPDRVAVRQYAERHGWEAVARENHALLCGFGLPMSKVNAAPLVPVINAG
jgi:glycosyltransferase involved in cell wall biosynthesis